jgi:hypothetical protein
VGRGRCWSGILRRCLAARSWRRGRVCGWHAAARRRHRAVPRACGRGRRRLADRDPRARRRWGYDCAVGPAITRRRRRHGSLRQLAPKWRGTMGTGQPCRRGGWWRQLRLLRLGRRLRDGVCRRRRRRRKSEHLRRVLLRRVGHLFAGRQRRVLDNRLAARVRRWRRWLSRRGRKY